MHKTHGLPPTSQQHHTHGSPHVLEEKKAVWMSYGKGVGGWQTAKKEKEKEGVPGRLKAHCLPSKTTQERTHAARQATKQPRYLLGEYAGLQRRSLCLWGVRGEGKEKEK